MIYNETLKLSEIDDWAGYAFDSVGDIWSSKTGDWRKLTRSSSGGYSLNFAGKRKYFSAEDIYHLWQANKMLGLEDDVGYQDLGEEIELDRKFIIGTIAGANISISQTPVVHLSELSASLEAERLARANPGKRFILMELKGICFVDNVAWS